MKYYNGIIIFASMLISIGCSNRQSAAPAEESVMEEEVSTRPGYDVWDYKSKTDEMDDTQVQLAHLCSENAIDLGYVDESKMHIIVRHREDNGNQVFFNVDFGTFDVDRIRNEASVRVRFGKAGPLTFKVRSLVGDDNSSVGLVNPSKFIKLAQNTDTILIEAPFFKKSNQLFKFHTAEPLKWSYL